MKLLAFLLSLFAFSAQLDNVVGQSYLCDDAYECDGLTMSATYVYCYGYFACDEADITSTYLYGYGFYSNYNSTVSTTYAYMYGYLSGYSMSLATQYVYGYGMYGVGYADIEPKSNYLYAYLYGYLAGYSADVSCYSGDYCYIYCGTANGCYTLNFYCYSGATCYYNCDDGYCPTLYGSSSALVTFDALDSDGSDGLSANQNHEMYETDSEIDAKKEENKAAKAEMVESGEMEKIMLEQISKDYKGKESELPTEVLESLKMSMSHDNDEQVHETVENADYSSFVIPVAAAFIAGLMVAGAGFKVNEWRKSKLNEKHQYVQLA